jgi:phthiodiolone/phenolphthiodiolone dimycocerosates ketoreductase
VWALGGGPKLLDLATSYADGFAAISPCVFDTPERFAEMVKPLREDIERKGRDPDAFGFGLWFMNAIHEDRDVLDRALDGAMMKWLAANFGRLDNSRWAELGIQSVFPDDWHYSVKLRPIDVTEEESRDVLARTPRAMVDASFSHGSPQEVAADVQGYIDAGCTYVSVCDVLPICLEPEDAQNAIGRSIEVCARIKQAAMAPA